MHRCSISLSYEHEIANCTCHGLYGIFEREMMIRIRYEDPHKENLYDGVVHGLGETGSIECKDVGFAEVILQR